jgi:protein-S-isoprenylcysteine O-methyltransferase Ste14
MPKPESLIFLAALWLAYFAAHSTLASLTLKRWVANRYPDLTPWYRLLFNFLAIALLLPPLWLMWQLGGEKLWQWQGLSAWLAYGLMLLAIVGFLWSLKFYDGSEFLGLRQLRQQIHEVQDQERFHISPLHRFVRHPWYSLGLVLVWTQEMDAARLVSSLMITLYFFLGSILEERKLMIFHGSIYQLYRRKVPGLIPLPWKYLTQEAARQLLRQTQEAPGEK